MYSPDVHGDVVEVYDRAYSDRFGSHITSVNVLDINAENPRATIIADLAAADSIPEKSCDCFIFTQTLQYVYDSRAALHHIHRILRPGGVLLATVPVLSRVDNSGEYWRFTQHACARLCGDVFGPRNVIVQARGNSVAAIAAAAGLAAEEFHPAELNCDDPGYPILACIRAIKNDNGDTALPA
jgi:SAM-dependent methyltransferase